MTDAERYAISVRKVLVDDDEVWRATVRELPDVAEFADSREEAISLALDTIESLKETAAADGHSFPEPIDDDEEFSGRVTLRLSKSMHRNVAQRADLEGVSLNSYVVECISIRSGALIASPGALRQEAYATVLGAKLEGALWHSQNFAQQFVKTVATITASGSGSASANSVAMVGVGGAGSNFFSLGSATSSQSERPWNQAKGEEDLGLPDRRRA